MRDGKLVVTYCENLAPSGAIVSYGFNAKTGKITGALDKTESWFSEYGDSKGICFNADGTKILVTFESNKPLTSIGKLFRKSIKSIRKLRKRIIEKILLFGQSLKIVQSRKSTELRTASNRDKIKIKKPTKNGIAIFSISPDGKIARTPDRIIMRENFCTLENINIFDDICVVTDVINHSFFIYDLTQDVELQKPVQTVNLGKVAPHGAKFSPDGRLLVISCLGLRIINQEIQFFDWESPREDKIIIFERAI
jgi:hypothetical protein